MTDRREFLAAMAALFAGVVLPVPVRESIWVAPYPQATVADLDRLLKQIFQAPILALQSLDFDRDTPKVALYTSEPLYFALPRQSAVG